MMVWGLAVRNTKRCGRPMTDFSLFQCIAEQNPSPTVACTASYFKAFCLMLLYVITLTAGISKLDLELNEEGRAVTFESSHGFLVPTECTKTAGGNFWKMRVCWGILLWNLHKASQTSGGDDVPLVDDGICSRIQSMILLTLRHKRKYTKACDPSTYFAVVSILHISPNHPILFS